MTNQSGDSPSKTYTQEQLTDLALELAATLPSPKYGVHRATIGMELDLAVKYDNYLTERPFLMRRAELKIRTKSYEWLELLDYEQKQLDILDKFFS
jgi:hypothetical protein